MWRDWDGALFHYPYIPDYEARKRENLSAPDDVARVVRGGSFLNDAREVGSAARAGNRPTRADGDIGFRVVVAPFIEAPGLF